MPTGKREKAGKHTGKPNPRVHYPPVNSPTTSFSVLNILSRLPVNPSSDSDAYANPGNPQSETPNSSISTSTTTPPPPHLRRSSSKAFTNARWTTSSPSSLSASFSLLPAAVHHSFPYLFLEMDVVRIHNGVVCLCQPPWGDAISIFNPATQNCKMIRLSATKPNPGLHERVSIGFGFDPVTNDYKVISIFSYKEELKTQARVEVYICNSDLWKKLEIKGPRFRFLKTKCEVVVKGVPYWLAVIEDDYGKRNVFVCFDVHNEVFGYMPVPVMDEGRQLIGRIVDWKGNFAVLALGEESTFLDVWVMEDDGGGVEWWNKKCSVGRILGMKRLVCSSWNGQIVGENGDWNFFLFDPENGGVESFAVDVNIEDRFAVFNYNENLVSLKGEMQITVSLDEERIMDLRNSTGLYAKIMSESDGDCYLVLPLEDGSLVGIGIPKSVFDN